MFGFFSKKSPETKQKQHPKPKHHSAFMYRLAERLKISGTFLSALDWSLSQAEYFSTKFKEYRYGTIPYWVHAIYYILPSLLPYLSKIKDFCHRKQDEQTPHTEAAEIFLEASRKIPNIKKALHDETTKKKFIELVESFQYDGNNVTVDICLNSMLFSLRTLHGFFFLLQGWDMTTQNTSDQIIDISGRVYNALNYAYVLILLGQKLAREASAAHHARRGLDRYNLYFWKAYEEITHPHGLPHSHSVPIHLENDEQKHIQPSEISLKEPRHSARNNPLDEPLLTNSRRSSLGSQ